MIFSSSLQFFTVFSYHHLDLYRSSYIINVYFISEAIKSTNLSPCHPYSKIDVLEWENTGFRVRTDGFQFQFVLHLEKKKKPNFILITGMTAVQTPPRVHYLQT